MSFFFVFEIYYYYFFEFDFMRHEECEFTVLVVELLNY